MSYYALLNIIKAELEATNLVNTVTEGDIFQVDLSKQTIFPLSHIMINNATFENNVIRYNARSGCKTTNNGCFQPYQPLRCILLHRDCL